MHIQKVLVLFGILFSFWVNLSSAAPEARTIVGKSDFQKRFTMVPMVICEGWHCPKSEPYWALVLVEDGIKYELSQSFHRGSPLAPEEIELAGVAVRPGVTLALTGDVHFITTQYAIVTDVHWVEVVQ